MPKVSVIIVIYNGKKYIKPVFDAILAQSFKDLEIIVVINKSEDGSRELIQTNYPTVKILGEGINLGFAAANNLGIANSQGELIQLVNQDLILEKDYIMNMV